MVKGLRVWLEKTGLLHLKAGIEAWAEDRVIEAGGYRCWLEIAMIGYCPQDPWISIGYPEMLELLMFMAHDMFMAPDSKRLMALLLGVLIWVPVLANLNTGKLASAP